MRVFVGLPLSDEAERGIARVVKELERGHWKVKWSKPHKLHLTVWFVGEVDAQEVGKVVEVARVVGRDVGPFSLRFKGLGAFPDRVLPKTVFVSLKGEVQAVHRLRREFEQRIGEIGVTQTARFVPHVTIGRVAHEILRKERLELGRVVTKKLEMEVPQVWRCEELVVYESDLSYPEGEYGVVERVKLGK